MADSDPNGVMIRYRVVVLAVPMRLEQENAFFLGHVASQL